jgi:hypothetical protein
MRVARLVGRRIVAADQQRSRPGERRFDRDALVDVDRPPLAAEVAHQGGGGDGGRELAAIGIDMQDAAFEMIVGERGFGAQRLQLTTAVEGEGDDLAHVGARPPVGALAQKAQAPVEQCPIPAQTEEQRRVLASHPGQRAPGGVRIGPGLGVRNGNLAAVGKAGFESGGRLAVEHGHLMPCPLQIPGTGDTDDAGADDQNLQVASPWSREMRTTSGMRRTLRIRRASAVRLATWTVKCSVV